MSSKFIFSCLIKVHCVEGLWPSLFQACSIIRTGNTQILQKYTADNLSLYSNWDRMEQSKNVDIDLFSIVVHLLRVSPSLWCFLFYFILFFICFTFFRTPIDDCHDILLCCVSKCSYTWFSKKKKKKCCYGVCKYWNMMVWTVWQCCSSLSFSFLLVFILI